jgi:osmotically-inducible protein OsmY
MKTIEWHCDLDWEVDSESKRARTEKPASTVPSVRQVMNELQVED